MSPIEHALTTLSVLTLALWNLFIISLPTIMLLMGFVVACLQIYVWLKRAKKVSDE